MKRAALVLGVGVAFAAAIAGIVLATQGQFSTRPAASPAAPELERSFFPNPYGLECPPEDMIADVDIEILPLRSGPPTPRDALALSLGDKEGLMSASAKMDDNAHTSDEVEFIFEADDGATVGRATVSEFDGDWYVTRYSACNSAIE